MLVTAKPELLRVHLREGQPLGVDNIEMNTSDVLTKPAALPKHQAARVGARR